MDRRDWYFRQLVTELELDGAFDAVEAADRSIVKDLGLLGVMGGLAITQSAVPGLSALISSGQAYDAYGQRIYVPVSQTVSLSTDSNGVSTAVGNSGNSKVISIFAQFTRANSDPRTDGGSNTVYFLRNESFGLIVRQGAESTDGTETAPALESDKILLADIKRTFGQTTIVDANINPSVYTNRRQDSFVGIANTVLDYRVNSIGAAIAALRDYILDGVISPGAISGTITAYNPTGFAAANLVRVNCSGATVLRSITAPAKPGTRKRLFNISTNTANTLTLNHQDTTGTNSADRVIGPNLANHVIRAGGESAIWYDGATSMWRVEAP